MYNPTQPDNLNTHHTAMPHAPEVEMWQLQHEAAPAGYTADYLTHTDGEMSHSVALRAHPNARVQFASVVFGSVEEAYAWLKRPNQSKS